MKSVIMVTLDCLRPDHLGFTGCRTVDTPQIDRVARQGVFFSQAIAQAPNTWVSHGSIFTGTYPFTHGVRSPYTRLSPRVKTLAEVLFDAGFQTAGFPAHTLMGPALGFNRGFSHFDLDKKEMLLSSDTAGHAYYRDWPVIWGKARQWLAGEKKPFFLWLHYMGTHELKPEAMNIPAEFLGKYPPLGQYYDAKISWADRQCVGDIEAYLQERELEDEVILVLISDHGDTLLPGKEPGEPGRAFHNRQLSEEVMNILWLMRNPGLLPAGITVTDQVRSIDIMPTLLDLLGIPIPVLVPGRSALDMIRSGRGGPDTEYAYLENLGAGFIGLRTAEWKLILGKKPESRFKQRWARFLCHHFTKKISSASNKLSNADTAGLTRHILDRGEVVAFFDLAADPQEQENLRYRFPDKAAAMRGILLDLVGQAGSMPAEGLFPGEEAAVAHKLQELGYLD